MINYWNTRFKFINRIFGIWKKSTAQCHSKLTETIMLLLVLCSYSVQVMTDSSPHQSFQGHIIFPFPNLFTLWYWIRHDHEVHNSVKTNLLLIFVFLWRLIDFELMTHNIGKTLINTRGMGWARQGIRNAYNVSVRNLEGKSPRERFKYRMEDNNKMDTSTLLQGAMAG